MRRKGAGCSIHRTEVGEGVSDRSGVPTRWPGGGVEGGGGLTGGGGSRGGAGIAW